MESKGERFFVLQFGGQSIWLDYGGYWVEILFGIYRVFLRVDVRCCCVLFFIGIEDELRKLFGVQFYLEVDLIENGVIMLKNFFYGVRINFL